MIIILSILLGLHPKTSQGKESDSYQKQALENACSYALSFAKKFADDDNLMVGDVLTFFDEEDQIAGYCISILNKQENNGYVTVKFSDHIGVISEFCLDSGVQNPYSEIISHFKISSCDLKYYTIGADNYQILDLTAQHVYCFSNEVMSISKFQEMKAQERAYKKSQPEDKAFYSGLDGYTVISDTYTGTINTSKTIVGGGSIIYYASDIVSTYGFTYACSVVADCNLLKYIRSRGFYNVTSSFYTLYNTIWNYAGTTSGGGTLLGAEPGAAKHYLEDVGYSCSYSYVNSFNSFMNNLNLEKPCVFAYGAFFGGSIGGHAIFVVGYVDTSAYQYLRVADGWHTYLRYINYSGYSYLYKAGWAFTWS